MIDHLVRYGLFALALLLAPVAARCEIFDYLLACPDAATCQSDPVIGKYWSPPSDDNPNGSWDGSRVISAVQVYQVTGTQQVTDPTSGQTYTQEIRCYYAGGTPACPGFTPTWDSIVALPSATDKLASSPYLMLIADRELAASGAPLSQFIVKASTVAQGLLGAALVSPTFAGSAYPFGVSSP